MTSRGGYPDGVYPAVVGELSHGASPGPASQMRYRLKVNFPAGVVEFVGVAPAWEREPDEVQVHAIKEGTGCAVGISAGHVQMYARELPERGDCTGNGDS